MCGSENESYSVTIRIRNLNSNEVKSLKSRTYSPVCIKYSHVYCYGFDIFFDNPVTINCVKLEGVSYRIDAYISGANSCFGQNGQYSVLCSGVGFDFKDSYESTNGTNLALGGGKMRDAGNEVVMELKLNVDNSQGFFSL